MRRRLVGQPHKLGLITTAAETYMSSKPSSRISWGKKVEFSQTDTSGSIVLISHFHFQKAGAVFPLRPGNELVRRLLQSVQENPVIFMLSRVLLASALPTITPDWALLVMTIAVSCVAWGEGRRIGGEQDLLDVIILRHSVRSYLKV